MEVKICGVCRAEDARAAAAAGADYLGVILSPGFSRSQDAGHAAAIFAAAGNLRRVGVFVDAAPAHVAALVRALTLHAVQLHGAEPADQVEALRRETGVAVWKAVRPRTAAELAALAAGYAAADALLLDGWRAGAVGGTGARAPWDALAEARRAIDARTRIVLAGGLDPANVARAAAALRPDVVDVSSGVESAPGRKSPVAIAAFVAAAHAADTSNRDG
ncbi:MAG TPA: phosphoribosylanthranilate isomerase [Longimicrobiales bacterium]|nr:phosphoribosylanthranilate isomerase [Longimicrobiales bacterium]